MDETIKLAKNWQVVDYYMNKMRDFYRLAGGISSFSSEMLEIKSKPTLSKKELYKRILEIQAEWKNDKYAQEHLSDGIKIFLNDTIEEQVELYKPYSIFDNLKNLLNFKSR